MLGLKEKELYHIRVSLENNVIGRFEVAINYCRVVIHDGPQLSVSYILLFHIIIIVRNENSLMKLI